MRFHAEPLSNVLAAARNTLHDASRGRALRDRVLGHALGALAPDAVMLQVGLNHYQDELGLTFVSSVKIEDKTLLAFSGVGD